MKPTRLLIVLFAVSLTLFAQKKPSYTPEQADWKQWRGPTGQGHANANLPTEWSETKNVKWRTPISGKGWSSPVIEDNKIWLTAAHETLASEAVKKERLKKDPSFKDHVLLSLVRLHAVCVDKRTGKLLHDLEIL